MTWTAADRLTLQRLRLQLGRVLHEAQSGKPTKVNLAALARCHRAAEKARYPTDDAEELALLRQWMRLVESYLDSDLALERTLHVGALSTLQLDVALILGGEISAASSAATSQDAADPLAPGRRPYWTDTD